MLTRGEGDGETWCESIHLSEYLLKVIFIPQICSLFHQSQLSNRTEMDLSSVSGHRSGATRLGPARSGSVLISHAVGAPQSPSPPIPGSPGHQATSVYYL